MEFVPVQCSTRQEYGKNLYQWVVLKNSKSETIGCKTRMLAKSRLADYTERRYWKTFSWENGACNDNTWLICRLCANCEISTSKHSTRSFKLQYRTHFSSWCLYFGNFLPILGVIKNVNVQKESRETNLKTRLTQSIWRWFNLAVTKYNSDW